MCLPVCLLIYELRTGKIKRQFQCDLKVGSMERTKPSGMSYLPNSYTRPRRISVRFFIFPSFQPLRVFKGNSLLSNAG